MRTKKFGELRLPTAKDRARVEGAPARAGWLLTGVVPCRKMGGGWVDLGCFARGCRSCRRTVVVRVSLTVAATAERCGDFELVRCAMCRRKARKARAADPGAASRARQARYRARKKAALVLSLKQEGV